MKADSNLFKMEKTGFNPAAETLIKAFSEDETIKKMNVGPGLLARMYKMPLKLGFYMGEVFTTSENFEGVMVVFPGEKVSPKLKDIAGSGVIFSMFGMLRLFLNKHMRKSFRILEKDKKNLDIGPFIYLSVLGVNPEEQGKGFGGKLLDYLCERADREGKALYLETQNMKNVRWYEKFGFKVLKHVNVCEWLSMWEMARSRKG